MSFALRPVWALTAEVRQVVNPANIPGDVVHYNIPALEATGEPTVEPAGDIKSGKLFLHGDEVLISRLNPRKSRVVRTRPADLPILASTEFVPLRPVDCDPRFLTYCLLSETTRQLLDSEVRSVTRSHQRVDPLHVTRLAIPTPRLEEQLRIADFLDDQIATIDRALALRDRQAALAREDMDAELDHYLDELATRGTLPLRRLARYIEQGDSPQCENRPANEGEWGVLKLSAVRAGEFRASENKALPSDVEPVTTYEIRDGDLLVTRANTPTLVGDVAVVRGAPRRLQLCDLIYRVHLWPGQSPDFVAATLLTSRNRSLVGAVARGTSSSMAKLRGEDILNLLLPSASAPEQARVAAMHVTSLDRKRSVGALLARSSVLLQERKHALITAAVTGQFDVTTARNMA